MILTRQGPGTVDNANGRVLFGSAGAGMLPLQAEPTGPAVQFRVLAKAVSEAPWREIIAAGSAGFIESIGWIPFIQLEIVSGTGTVTLYVGEA